MLNLQIPGGLTFGQPADWTPETHGDCLPISVHVSDDPADPTPYTTAWAFDAEEVAAIMRGASFVLSLPIVPVMRLSIQKNEGSIVGDLQSQIARDSATRQAILLLTLELDKRHQPEPLGRDRLHGMTNAGLLEHAMTVAQAMPIPRRDVRNIPIVSLADIAERRGAFAAMRPVSDEEQSELERKLGVELGRKPDGDKDHG